MLSRNTPTAVPNRQRLRRALLAWYRRAARDLPWRRTRDPYAIWISETMLQQTTVDAVIPFYERFLARVPDIRTLARSREEDVLALWSGLGYYRRARNLRTAASRIVERHGGEFPTRYEQILALPGVGPYTAGAVASIAFGARTPAVDGNAARVLSRLFGLSNGDVDARSSSGHRRRAPRALLMRSTPPDRHPGLGPHASRAGERSRGTGAGQLRELAAELAPKRRAGDWNQALMELGARVCRPSAPCCEACPVSYACRALADGDIARYTPKRRRPRNVDVRAALVAVERRGRVLLVRRPERELLGGLWELPGTLAAALRDSARSVRAGEALREPAGREQGAAAACSEPRVRSGHGPFDRSGRGSPRNGTSRRRLQPPSGAARGNAAPGDPEAARDLSRVLRRSLGFTPVGLARRGAVGHSVTHRRLTIDAWRAEAPAWLPAALRALAGGGHRWAEIARLDTVPLGAASRKVIRRILGD